MVKAVRRYSVCLINLDPTVGSEIKKTRPCLVVSPDEMNKHIRTVIVAPMTSIRKGYPSRVPVRFKGKDGEIVLDQIRTVDKRRIVQVLGSISEKKAQDVADRLVEIFAF